MKALSHRFQIPGKKKKKKQARKKEMDKFDLEKKEKKRKLEEQQAELLLDITNIICSIHHKVFFFYSNYMWGEKNKVMKKPKMRSKY